MYVVVIQYNILFDLIKHRRFIDSYESLMCRESNSLFTKPYSNINLTNVCARVFVGASECYSQAIIISSTRLYNNTTAIKYRT